MVRPVTPRLVLHYGLRAVAACMLFPSLHHVSDFDYLVARVASLHTFPFSFLPGFFAAVVLFVEVFASVLIVVPHTSAKFALDFLVLLSGRFGGPKVFALLDSFERVGTAANCIRVGAALLLPKMLVAVYGHGFVPNFDAGFSSKNHAYYENAVFSFGGDGQNWALGSSWQCGFFGAGWYLVAYALLAAGVGPTAVVDPVGKNAPAPVGTKMAGSGREKKKRSSSGGRRKSAAKRTSSTGRAKK